MYVICKVSHRKLVFELRPGTPWRHGSKPAAQRWLTLIPAMFLVIYEGAKAIDR